MLNAAASTKAFVLNIADSKTSIPMLQELCSKKIPVVFFGSSPDERELANCPLDYDLRGDDMTAGVTQGLLVAQAYKDNPKMDKNADGKI